MSSGSVAAIARSVALASLLSLAACSTTGVGTAVSLRSIDLLNDDIANAVLALDVPTTLVPIIDGSSFALVANAGDEEDEQRFEVELVRADADLVEGVLPEPDQDRGYYLFGFSDQGKGRLRDGQIIFRAARETDVTVSVSLEFCARAEIDPDRTRFTVHVAMPGTDAFEPLIDDEPIADLLEATGNEELQLCADVE